MCPSTPACCAAHARPGEASPRTSAILPAARCMSSGRPSPTSTSSASSASTEVENEWVSPWITEPSGRARRASCGRLMNASISRRSTSTP